MKRSCKAILVLTFFQVVSGSVQVPLLLEREAGEHNSSFGQPWFGQEASGLEKKTRKIRAARDTSSFSLPVVQVRKKKKDSFKEKRGKRKHPAQVLKELEERNACLEEDGNKLKAEVIALNEQKSDLLFAYFLNEARVSTKDFEGVEENAWEDLTLFVDDPLMSQLKKAEKV